MRLRAGFLLAPLALIVMSAAPADAQQTGPRVSAPLRGYLIGGVGVSLDLPQAGTMVSAEIAENVHRDLQVYVTASFADNVMSDVARDELADAAELLEFVTGTPWELTGRDRARSVTLGMKYLVPTATSVRPYVGAGFGVLNLRRSIRDRVRGNVTDEFLTEFGASDGAIDPAQTNTNRPLGELAGGVGVAIGRAYVDVGYRYRRAFHTGRSEVALSQVGVAIGLKF
jgi:hypothetical protein